MAHGFIITEKDWEHQTPEQQNWLIFSAIQSIDGRLQVLEGKSFINKAWSAAGGLLGGAIAALSFKIWGT